MPDRRRPRRSLSISHIPRSITRRCLAYAIRRDLHGNLTQAATATATRLDVHGAPVTITGHGLVSRRLQHETDHLDGMLYLHRLPAKQRRAALTEASPDRVPA